MLIASNSKFDPATLGFDLYPPVAGRNSKQIQMTKMTLGVILRRSRRNWPANDEILRFAQNDSFAVSFENLNIRILNLFRISDFVLRILHRKVPFTLFDDVVVLIFLEV